MIPGTWGSRAQMLWAELREGGQGLLSVEGRTRQAGGQAPSWGSDHSICPVSSSQQMTPKQRGSVLLHTQCQADDDCGTGRGCGWKPPPGQQGDSVWSC